MICQPPEALVRGCNDPISIGILSDWIEEQYGLALDLDRSGWDDVSNKGYGNGICCIYMHNGNGTGHGFHYGNGFGNGFGVGYGWLNGNGAT